MGSSAKTEFAAHLRALLEKHNKPMDDDSPHPKLLYADLERQRRALRERFLLHPYHLNQFELARVQQETEETFYSQSVERVRAIYKRLSNISFIGKDPRYVEYACRTLSFGLFRPWHRQEFYTCADVFSRLGGIRLICQWAVSWVKSPRWKKTEEVEALAMIMSSCWNFCSNDERSKHLLDAGVMPLLVSLLGDKNDTPKGICRKALGLLWSVIEYGDVQVRVAEDSAGVVDALFHVCRQNRSEDPLMSEMAAGSLHMCASNFHCIPAFAPKVGQFFDAIRSCMDSFPESAMVGYVSCLALGGLLTNLHRQLWIWVSDCAVLWHNSKRGEPCRKCQDAIGPLYTQVLSAVNHFSAPMVKLIRKWLAKHRPQEVRKIEFGHYVWRYIHPFSILLRCSLSVVREMGAFALANLAQGSDNRDRMVAEEGHSVPSLQCASYSQGSAVRKLARDAMKPFHLDGVEPMSLQDICIFYISQNSSRYYDARALVMLPKSVRHRILPYHD